MTHNPRSRARRWAWCAFLAVALLRAVPAGALAVPLDASSPWPEMRHDRRNSGRSPIVARYHGDRPWAFRRSWHFSTPVIGGDGTVYVGSGDTYFYAIGAEGRLRWRLKTGGSSTPPVCSPAMTPSSVGATDVRLGG